MAEIKLIIPNDKIQEIIDACCWAYSYQAELIQESGPSIPNPETKGQFTRKQIKQFILNNVHAYRAHLAKLAAEAAKDPTDINITVT